MKTNVIKMFPLPEGYMVAIRGIIPDENTPMSGIIILSGNPINCIRKERYWIKGGVVTTESWHFPASLLIDWLVECGSCTQSETGETVALLSKITPDDEDEECTNNVSRETF